MAKRPAPPKAPATRHEVDVLLVAAFKARDAEQVKALIALKRNLPR